MIPQSFIQELLSRCDIVEVVGRAVQLKKAGANFLGLCPFHGEKSPSFTVSPAKQFYHCFGCGVHGSAIGFVMENQGLTYVEAIESLAQSMGLVVPHERGNQEQAAAAPGLLQVMDMAAAFYRSRLKDAPNAIEYLKNRGLTGETAKRFGLGFAPGAWRNLEAAFADYAQEELETAGLVIVSEDKRYDRFRDRVMFPIRNPRGQTIGFGGRVIGAGEPKYLNSPETPLFVKGRELYGLFEGREAIRQANAVLVVEGYMDVVMLAQHGVGNAVATLGTATTAQHLQKLIRLVDRVVFSFDGDKAGRKAAWRALEAALPVLSDAKQFDFLFLPAEHDPDSFVREYGCERFQDVLDEALPLSQVLMDGLSEQIDLSRMEGRAQLQALAKPLLQKIPPIALRAQLLRSIASLAQTDALGFERYCEFDKAPAPSPLEPQGTTGTLQNSKHGQSKFQRKESNRQSLRRAGYRAPVAASDHLRWVLAVNPWLSRRIPDDARDWLPTELCDWAADLSDLPEGATFATVLELSQGQSPEISAWLGSRAASEPGVSEALSPQEAEKEFLGAVYALADLAVHDELNAIVGRSFTQANDRSRYDELNLLRRNIKSKRMV